MANTAQQALAYAAAGPTFGVGQCLHFVVSAYEVSGPYPDAASAYAGTQIPGTGVPVAGAPLWWTGGEHGHGHVALATGDGGCWSTDFTDAGYQGDGHVHRLRDFHNIAAQDALLSFRGWSYDLVGTQVIPTEPAPAPEGDDMFIIKDYVHAEPGKNAPLWVSFGNAAKLPLSYTAWDLLGRPPVHEVHKTGEPLYGLLSAPTLQVP